MCGVRRDKERDDEDDYKETWSVGKVFTILNVFNHFNILTRVYAFHFNN